MGTVKNKEQISPARKRSLANLRPIKKGRSGNPKGRPPGKSLKVLLREKPESERKAVIDKMFALAKRGDVRAAEWIAKHGDPAVLEVQTKDFTITLAHPDDDE